MHENLDNQSDKGEASKVADSSRKMVRAAGQLTAIHAGVRVEEPRYVEPEAHIVLSTN